MACPQIVEVIRRTEQGVTQPFICKAEDGFLYFVKGRGAGHPSLIKEWIAGSLAKRFGLPIPDFAILEVPKALFHIGKDKDLVDLGHGPVFGSRAVDGTQELSMSEAAKIDDELKQDIAVFDWWILNGDRTLSESGGNPNILWALPTAVPYVIDHNLAFDPTVTRRSLEEGHIFGRYLSQVVQTPTKQDDYRPRFASCLTDWKIVIEGLPDEWGYLDEKQSVPTPFWGDDALPILRRFATGALWGEP